MADKMYMPQERILQGTKPGTHAITNSGFEARSEGRGRVGFPKAYQDNFSRPVITHNYGNTLHDSATDGGFVTKTETNVEYIRVPMGTIHGNESPSTLSPLLQQTPKVDEYISNVKRETTRSYKTGPGSSLYWWCKPNSNGNGGQADHGQPNNTGVKRYYKPSDASMSQQHIHNHLHRNEKAPEGKQESIVSSTDEWHRSTHLGHKGIPHAKPANVMDTATDYLKDARAILVPAQGYVPAPMGSKAEVLLPAIDSREAARRYGGLSTSDEEAYTPAIDSNEAAWKYRGQML